MDLTWHCQQSSSIFALIKKRDRLSLETLQNTTGRNRKELYGEDGTKFSLNGKFTTRMRTSKLYSILRYNDHQLQHYHHLSIIYFIIAFLTQIFFQNAFHFQLICIWNIQYNIYSFKLLGILYTLQDHKVNDTSRHIGIFFL